MGMSYVRIYMDSLGPLEALSDEQRGRVLLALMHLATDGPAVELDPMSNIVFMFLRNAYDRDCKAYAAQVEGGKKGGRPKKEKQNPGFSEKPKVSEENPGFSEKPSLNIREEKKGKEKKRQEQEKKEKENVVVVKEPADAEPAAPEATTTTTQPRENDVIAYFVAAGSHPAQAVQFIIYNNARGWMQGNTRVVDWRPIADRWIAQQAQHDSKGQGQTKAKTSYERNMEALDQAVANLEGRTQ